LAFDEILEIIDSYENRTKKIEKKDHKVKGNDIPCKHTL